MVFGINSRFVLSIFSVITLLSFNNCSSGSSSSSSSSTDDDSDSDSGALEVTLSGQVAVRAEDVAGSLSAPNLIKGVSKLVRPKFATIGDTVLTEAEVALVQINADGTEEEITTTTTDAEGNYTLAEVPVCQAGTGASDDFYYEIQVTSGDTVVKAPVCPTGDEEAVTADVSPETTIAADVIGEVADPQSLSDKPVPSADEFVEVTALVANNIDDIEDSIEIPALSDSEGIVDLANGIAAAGGDAEISYKSFQFESEYTGLANSEDTTTEQLTGYVARVAKEACDQPSSTPILEAAAEALAEVIAEDTTYTPADVVAAYNEASDTDATAAEVVANYAELLDTIESSDEIVDTNALIKKAELLDDSTMVAAFTQHDLTSESLSESTELTADQALTMMLSIPDDPCTFSGSFDLTDAIAALTESATLASPTVSEVEIYSDSGHGCNDGDGDGHFVANVKVYIPTSSAVSVTGVAITSSDTTALGGDGSVTLTQSGGTWSSNVDGNCVTQDQEVTYTVTATLSDSSTVTKEVTRNHPDTPETQLTQDGTSLSGDQNSPSVLDVTRPTFTWTAPEDVLDQIASAPEGSQIKYQIEFAHYQVGSGSPMSNSAACPQISFGPWYSTDNFIPTVDCDVAACATERGLDPEDVMCRVSLQTYLLDETDDKLAQGAGNFKFFCVDTNGDDDCGE